MNFGSQGLEGSGLEVIFTRYFTRYDVLARRPGASDFGHQGSIVVLGVSCEDIEESSMMRSEVRVLSRSWKALKNMNKIRLVPGRGLETGEFLQ